MPRNVSGIARDRARQARRDPSVAEAIVWTWLRSSRLGFKFRREHPIGPYRLDFYCREAMLAVELDGEQHDPVRDVARDAALSEVGIYTFRIPNRELFGLDERDCPNFVDEIQRLCEQRSGRAAFPVLGLPLTPNPSPPEGRGEPG